MKASIKRLLRLEVRFGWRAASPSVDEEIFGRLAAGDWQSALRLLEPRERHLWEERQSIGCRRKGPNHTAHFDFRDLSQLRQTLDKSLGGLPWEVRENIARQLLAADTESGIP
jgi:hypothetical protein